VFEQKRQGRDYVYKLITKPGEERVPTPKQLCD
jgi:hypothetical protein